MRGDEEAVQEADIERAAAEARADAADAALADPDFDFEEHLAAVVEEVQVAELELALDGARDIAAPPAVPPPPLPPPASPPPQPADDIELADDGEDHRRREEVARAAAAQLAFASAAPAPVAPVARRRRARSRRRPRRPRNDVMTEFDEHVDGLLQHPDWHWMPFRMKYKKQGPGLPYGAVQCTCPHHRKSDRTGCKKTLNIAEADLPDILEVSFSFCGCCCRCY